MTEGVFPRGDYRETSGVFRNTPDVIQIKDENVRSRLKQKLQEYKQRNQKTGIPYDQPEIIKEIGDYSEYLAYLKEMVLRILLELPSGKKRSDEQKPVSFTTIAHRVQRETGWSTYLAVDSVFIEKGDGAYIPNRDQINIVAEQDTKLADTNIALQDAYLIIRSYAQEEPWNVNKGTGLPQSPEKQT